MVKHCLALFAVLSIETLALGGGEIGGAGLVNRMSAMVADGRLAPPANIDSIVSDRELPVTELSPEELDRLRLSLHFTDFAPLPNDPDARAMRIGETVISQDIDRVVTEIREYQD